MPVRLVARALLCLGIGFGILACTDPAVQPVPAPQPVSAGEFVPAIALEPAGGYAGVYVQVTGQDWPANRLVTIVLGDDIGQSHLLAAANTDETGRLATGFLYPIGDRWLSAGPYTVIAETADGRHRAQAEFLVVSEDSMATPSPFPSVTATVTLTVAVSATPAVSDAATPVPVQTPPTSQPVLPTATITPTVTPVRPTPLPVDQKRGDDDDDDDDDDRKRPVREGRNDSKASRRSEVKPRRDLRPRVVITICKVPPGNPNAAHTIRVAPSAVKAHLRSGSTLGPCP